MVIYNIKKVDVAGKINFFIKFRNVILIIIEVMVMFVLYRIAIDFMFKPIINYVDGFENLKVSVANNVLTQINKDNEVYYIKSKVINLTEDDGQILLFNNTIETNNVNGFAKKIVNLEKDGKVILENRPIIKIKKFQQEK